MINFIFLTAFFLTPLLVLLHCFLWLHEFGLTMQLATNIKKENVPSKIKAMKKKVSCNFCKSCCNCISFYHNVSVLLADKITQAFPNHAIIKHKFTNKFVEKFVQMRDKYKSNPAAKIYVCYHWTLSKNYKSIIDSNLVVPDGHKVKHRTDNGYFGEGIYMSPDYKYGIGHGDYGKHAKVFVCLALPGKQYPATYPEDRGTSLKDGYDSHVSASRNNKEWVFFDSSQLLPCCLVTLQNIETANKIAQIIISWLQTL